MREEASTVSWTIRLGTGPIESGKQLRGRWRVSSTGDDLSRNGAKFRRTDAKIRVCARLAGDLAGRGVGALAKELELQMEVLEG